MIYVFVDIANESTIVPIETRPHKSGSTSTKRLSLISSNGFVLQVGEDTALTAPKQPVTPPPLAASARQNPQRQLLHIQHPQAVEHANSSHHEQLDRSPQDAQLNDCEHTACASHRSHQRKQWAANENEFVREQTSSRWPIN
jgi:hypothetical protein